MNLHRCAQAFALVSILAAACAGPKPPSSAAPAVQAPETAVVRRPLETQAFAGDRFVAAREAGSGNATGVHDIHMNQANTQSIQQQIQSENQRIQADW